MMSLSEKTLFNYADNVLFNMKNILFKKIDIVPSFCAFLAQQKLECIIYLYSLYISTST